MQYTNRWSVAEFSRDRVVIAGPHIVYWFVARNTAIQDVARVTGLGLADQDVVDPAAGFESGSGIGVYVVPGIAGSLTAGHTPCIMKE